MIFFFWLVRSRMGGSRALESGSTRPSYRTEVKLHDMNGSRPRILLISLLGSTDNPSVKSLLAVLRQAGHDATILFFPSTDDRDYAAAARFVREQGYDLVGISLMSPFFHKAATLSRALRETAGGRKPIILWGGIHPTIDPESCFEHADWICVGEAEHALLRFVDGWRDGAVTPVAGFNRRGGGAISACTPIENLDALPWPDHHPSECWILHRGRVRPLDLRLFRRYGRYGSSYLSIMTTRGCPNQCTYCCNHLLARTNGRRIRRRSAGSALEEIRDQLARYRGRVHYIDIIDDCFTVHTEEWLREFAEGCRPFGIPVVFRAIPQFMTEQKALELSRVPAGFALLGLQSGSDRTNVEIYGRPHSRQRILDCARLLHRHHIPAIYDVIVDNPYEEPDDWAETAGLLHELPPSSHLFLYSLTFYRNTLLYDRAREDGLAVDAHLTKSQDHYDETSLESRWLRLALHFDPGRVRRLLESPNAAARVAVGGLELSARLLLDPIRLVRLAWMSQQGRVARLLPLGLDFTREFLVKIYAPRRVQGGYIADAGGLTETIGRPGSAATE